MVIRAGIAYADAYVGLRTPAFCLREVLFATLLLKSNKGGVGPGSYNRSIETGQGSNDEQSGSENGVYVSITRFISSVFGKKWWLTIRIVYFPSYQVKVPNPRWQYKEPRFWGILSWDLYPGSFNENRFKLTFHLDPWKQCPIDPSDLYDTKQQTWGYNWDSAKMMVKRLTLFGCKAQWCICNLALDENDISSREASTCTAKQESSVQLSWERRWLSSFQSAVQSALSREMRARAMTLGFLDGPSASGELNCQCSWSSDPGKLSRKHPATQHIFRMEKDGQEQPTAVSFVNTFCHILVNWYRPGPIFFNRPPLQMAACPIVDTLPAVDTDPGGSWKNGWTTQTLLKNPTGPFPSGGLLHYTILLYIYISRCTYGYYIYILYYIILYYIVLYCIVLYYIILYYIVLYYIILYILYYIILYIYYNIYIYIFQLCSNQPCRPPPYAQPRLHSAEFLSETVL